MGSGEVRRGQAPPGLAELGKKLAGTLFSHVLGQRSSHAVPEVDGGFITLSRPADPTPGTVDPWFILF